MSRHTTNTARADTVSDTGRRVANTPPAVGA
jgi:hypothetical protein